VRLAGAGAFPDPGRARVLFTRVEADGPELDRLAVGVRAAANRAGAGAAGGPFRAHVTLARTGRPVEATRWLRALETYRGEEWTAREVALVASYLGEGARGRPRHDVVETFPMGGPSGFGNQGETGA
jgi:2'-5' RNA ligase